ncbi:DUF1097 domain-containing protein [Paraburkholderia sp. J12]|uniref:DUF1097 domain-containing protein n=1 Tax=Paraburkholderia sp. J12 TaxID=2805432 RepID=UPI002ABD49CA|nr:DUF1097 domain-containing protein [Paraburkholderia sp. J12]
MNMQRTLVQNESPSRTTHSHSGLLLHALVSGVIAAIASVVCYKAKLPVWTMLLGWVVLHTSEMSWRKVIASWINFVLGTALGMAATLGVEWLIPKIHLLALPLAVFLSTVIIVSVRAARPLNNVLATFLGLIAFLASHVGPTYLSLSSLVVATTVGVLAGWIAHLTQRVRLGSAKE